MKHEWKIGAGFAAAALLVVGGCTEVSSRIGTGKGALAHLFGEGLVLKGIDPETGFNLYEFDRGVIGHFKATLNRIVKGGEPPEPLGKAVVEAAAPDITLP